MCTEIELHALLLSLPIVALQRPLLRVPEGSFSQFLFLYLPLFLAYFSIRHPQRTFGSHILWLYQDGCRYFVIQAFQHFIQSYPLGLPRDLGGVCIPISSINLQSVKVYCQCNFISLLVLRVCYCLPVFNRKSQSGSSCYIILDGLSQKQRYI